MTKAWLRRGVLSLLLLTGGWPTLMGQFLGGAGDGHGRILLVSAVPCASFFSAQMDGSARGFLANPDSCGYFDGGRLDGGANAVLVNPDPCGYFDGGLSDGQGRGVYLDPVACTAFLASQRDGYAKAQNSCSVLQVEASELYGRTEGKDGFLWWYTFSETNNLGFIVQRSVDQLTWTEIGFAEGYGNSDRRQLYEVWDREMENGLNYYRWEQVDIDGTRKWSNVVALVKEAGGADQLVVYPSPLQAGDGLHVYYQGGEVGAVQVSVVDTWGKVVLQEEHQPVAFPLELTVPTDRLATGIYILTFRTAARRMTARFVIH